MIAFDKSVDNIIIVGCGGVASWLLQPLVKFLEQTESRPTLVLYDGDTIEERNLDRQWFDAGDIGKNKAEAMSSKLTDDYPIEVVSSWYMDGQVLPVDGVSLFIGCADNHTARRAILAAVDRGEGYCIIGGNEYTEAEAYYYDRSMKDSPVDPRKYIPAILTDDTGDPARPEGCTGPAQVAAPQLVFANYSAANAIIWLMYHHFVERPALGKDYLHSVMPIRIWNYGAKFITHRMKEMVEAAQPKEKE